MRNLSSLLAKVSIAIAFFASFSACNPEDGPSGGNQEGKPVAVTGVKLDNSEISLVIGESATLTLTVSPSGASNKTATWSSSDASVATVSDGVVRAVKEGSATVTVTVDGKTATCTIKVVKGGFPEGQVPPDNEIWYITSDNKPLTKLYYQGEGIIQWNKYSGGMGVLHFSKPVTSFGLLDDIPSECAKITGLLLPDCVESIDYTAFMNAYGIKEFRVPASLRTVEGGFGSKVGTSVLERFTGNHVSEDGRCVIIDGVLYGFASAGIDSYEVPYGVETVFTRAFAYSKNLKTLVLPSSVKELKDFVFEESGIETITIPSSITALDAYAFFRCDNLKNLLGDSPYISSDRKFLYDPNAYHPGTIFFFAGKDDTSYEVPEGIQGIEHYSFANCINLRSLTLPNSLVYVGSSAFKGCDNLESLYGPCTTEDHKGFVNAGGQLQFLVPGISDDYVIPDNVTSIGNSLFEGRKTLRSVTMGDQVTDMGFTVFSGCSSLKTVTFSANLVSIGEQSFTGADAIETIYFRGIIPPSLKDIRLKTSPKLNIFVPSPVLNQYTSSSNWSAYKDYIKPYDYTDLPEFDYYISSDYSKEGEVTVYQRASEGNGIDIVFLGDAYSDRQVASGMYINDMKACAEEYFSVEPYKSFRHLFNIYFVTTISTTEGYEHGGRSLGTVPLQGTAITGDDSKCLQLALKAVQDEKRMDEVLVVVCGNQDLSGPIRMCGTCNMMDPEDWAGRDYGSGPSVAYFLKVDESLERTGEVLRHEAGGHGFAKLGDEYHYSGAIQSYDLERIQKRSPYGWYSNVDLTSDPAKIKWSVFLSDERYKYDGVGIFEGGFTYLTGVWRPSENSIMNENSYGIFNAPSRYAIWYRIHKLAYGKAWKGTYEDFVAYDAVNRKTSATSASLLLAPRRQSSGQHKTTSAPVIVGRTWRDVIEK